MEYLKRIGHCTFACRDYRKMTDFYINVLGFEKIYSVYYSEEKIEAMKARGFSELKARPGDEWITSLKISDRQILELFNLPYNGNGDRRNGCFEKLTIAVDDLPGTMEILRERGAEIVSQNIIRDPEGNYIEFI